MSLRNTHTKMYVCNKLQQIMMNLTGIKNKKKKLQASIDKFMKFF